MLDLSKFSGQNYIDGRWMVHEKGTDFFASLNPAHYEEVIGLFPKSGNQDVGEAVWIAKKAFCGWRSLGMVKRAEYLKRLTHLLDIHRGPLAQLVTRESGKQKNEAMADVVEAVHTCEYATAVGVLGRRGEVVDLEVSAKDAFSELHPRGVVVCISPWNFPIAIPFWEMALALVYGNTVVFKPSEDTAACGEAIAKLMHEAGFPNGVFNLVHGDGSTGWKLVQDPGTDVVLFTGSWEVGNKIKQEVAKHPNKNCTIETGSKSSILVLDDAPEELAVSAGILSAFKTAGQRCVSASRIIVGRKFFNRYVDRFLDVARRIQVGDPNDEQVFYGPMINHAAVSKGQLFNEKARGRFRVLLDRNNEDLPTKNGYWLRPFVYETEWRVPDDVLQQEPFSPHVALIPAYDVEDAVRIYNDTPFGLSAAVITGDYEKAVWAKNNLECGLFYWNLPCIGADVRLPFGGVKQSGNLIPSAAGIIPAITHNRAVTYNRGKSIVMAQGLSAKV